MPKPIFRFNKTRQDKLVEELAAQLSTPESYTHELSAEKMIEAFARLSAEGLQDYPDDLAKTNAPVDEQLDPKVIQLRSRHLGECAWEHFRQHAQERFHLALIELMHESLGFSDAIYTERCGGSAEEIEDARPLREEVQQNVLRHAVLRLNKLPVKQIENDWHATDDDNNHKLSVSIQVARIIFRDIALWSYDHQAVFLTLKNWINGVVQKHNAPEDEARILGNEAADLIWENIDGAIQVMLLILVNWVLLLSKQSAFRRHEVEPDLDEAKQIQPSKEQLKKIANTSLNQWIEQLSFDWRGQGRPVKTTSQTVIDRERLSLELHEIAAAITANGKRVTWEALASGRKRPPDNPQSGDALRKEATALNLPLSEFKPENN